MNAEPKSERDANGRFVAGNSGGPGNAAARHAMRFRTWWMKNVSEEDVERVYKAIVEKAADGNVSAQKLFLHYTLGKPSAVAFPDAEPDQASHCAPIERVKNDTTDETEPIETVKNEPTGKTAPIQTAKNDPTDKSAPIQTVKNGPSIDSAPSPNRKKKLKRGKKHREAALAERALEAPAGQMRVAESQRGPLETAFFRDSKPEISILDHDEPPPKTKDK